MQTRKQDFLTSKGIRFLSELHVSANDFSDDVSNFKHSVLDLTCFFPFSHSSLRLFFHFYFHVPHGLTAKAWNADGKKNITFNHAKQNKTKPERALNHSHSRWAESEKSLYKNNKCFILTATSVFGQVGSLFFHRFGSTPLIIIINIILLNAIQCWTGSQLLIWQRMNMTNKHETGGLKYVAHANTHNIRSHRENGQNREEMKVRLRKKKKKTKQIK